MKKSLYILLIIITISFLLSSCLKKDDGHVEVFDSVQLRPLAVVDFNLPKAETKTINGVDYLTSRGEVGKFGGDFITSTIGEGPKTFNPFNSNDATSSALSSIMYDGLFTTDPYTGEIIPRLAKSIKILPDKKTYLIELRKGLKWSDGKKITADDVYFTYNTIVFGGFGDTSLRDSMYANGKLPTIEKIDDYTIKFVTPVPFAPFLRNLTSPIAPKHVFEIATNKGKNFFRTFYSTDLKIDSLVVSGPFILKEYVPAQRLIYHRNPNYYVIDKNNNKLPYLDRYLVLIVGDLNNELLKFEAGELDVVSVRGKDLPRFKAKEKKSDFKIYNLGPNTGTMFLAFNLNSRKDKNGNYYVDPIKLKWFNDKNFRAAIDYAIDRKAMVSNILNNVAQPLFTSESLSSIYLNENIAGGHEKDIEYAKNLLKESGFYLDNKGYLRDKDGNEVEFDLYTNAGQTEREAAGVMVKEDLRHLGIKINFKPIEFNSLVSKMMSTSDWDMVLMGLTGNPLEPHTGLNVWNSKGHLHLFNMRFATDTYDDILPWEEKIDDIFEKGAFESEFEKRKVYYDEYQQIIYDERPIIYLYSPLTITAVRNKVKNLYPTALGGTLHNIEQLYIEE